MSKQTRVHPKEVQKEPTILLRGKVRESSEFISEEEES